MFHGRTVIVGDGNVEKAMRKFKKKIQNSGLLMELRDRETFTKPTTRRKVKAGQAKARNCLRACFSRACGFRSQRQPRWSLAR